MNTAKNCSRAAFMMLMMVLLSPAQTQPQPTALAVSSARISEVRGEVIFRSAHGEALVPSRGLVLVANSTIETVKGSTLLDLPDGSQVLVKSHSQVVLRAPSEEKGFSLELLLGRLVAKVQKRLGNSPSFKMGTPTAVITVRGTQFSVDVDKKLRTYVIVYEGLVEVAGPGALDRPVFIRPGFWTEVERGRLPHEPREQMRPDDRFDRNRGDDDGRRAGQSSWGSEPGNNLPGQNQPGQNQSGESENGSRTQSSTTEPK